MTTCLSSQKETLFTEKKNKKNETSIQMVRRILLL
jgi:hypothetical protein